MKKILLVSPNTSNSGHGVVYLTKLYEYLSKQCDVHVFVPQDTKIDINLFKKDNVIKSTVGFSFISREEYTKYGKFGQVIRGFNRLKTGKTFYKTLLNYLSNNEYDIVHVLDSEYLSFIYFARRMKTVELIYTIHASDFNFQSFSLSTIYKSVVAVFLKKALSLTAHIVCHGEWIKNRLLISFPNIKGKISSFIYPSDEYKKYNKTKVREKLKVDKGTVLISFLGMVRRDKRIEVALDTIKLLPNKYKLLIAGSLADYSLKDINNLIEEKNVSDRIIRDFRYLTDLEFKDYFMASDVFLSTHDPNFPSASGPVSDARTYGLPVVVTPGGQIDQYVHSEKVGVVSQGSEASNYSDAIIKLYDRIETFEGNVIRASHDFSWQSFSNAHMALYNEIG